MPGVEPVLDEVEVEGAVVLVGEIHGTDAIPEAFARLVCHAAARGAVLVGLEIPRNEQGNLDAYLASDGGEQARAALLAGSFWHGEWRDGRSSVAMLDLLDALRRLAATHEVRVLAFDVAEGSDADIHRDREMAHAIIAARAQAGTATRIVALTGNLHALKTIGTPWDPSFEPMGMFLDAAVPKLVTLDSRYRAGTAWVCLSNDPSGGGPKETKGITDTGEVPRIEPATDGTRYDALLYVGAISASPPAVHSPPIG